MVPKKDYGNLLKSGLALVIFILLMLWLAYNAATTQYTERSEAFLKSYGYTDIKVNTRSVGCDFDNGSVMSDGGRVFEAKNHEGKLVTGLVCTTKNNLQKLIINWKEQ